MIWNFVTSLQFKVFVGEFSNMDWKMGHFQNKGDEVEYLRHTIIHLQQQLEDTKEHVIKVNSESEEFKESSLLLEKELENSLEQTEKKNNELQYQCNKLTMELEEMKGKLQEVRATCGTLSSDISKCKEIDVERASHIRHLEQENDDLERALRAANDCKMHVEQRLDEVLEKDALRESEHEEALILIHRLEEQNKDLADELRRRQRLSSMEKSRCEMVKESRLSVQTQTNVIHPFRSKVSRALQRTRDMGRSLNCMARDSE